MDADSFWKGYLMARRERFAQEKRALIGGEYNSNTNYWDSMIEQEWLIFKDRLSTGFDVSKDVKAQLGLDYFTLDEIHSPVSGTYTLESGETLPFYAYEDYVMLSNQGIFREEDFILDRERRWQPKVEKLLAKSGYQRVDVIWDGGVSYLRFCKRTD